jgi:hypothetical protein
MAAEKKSFLLRINPQLWAALEKLAATELRSVNGQIEYLLRDAVGKRGLLGNGDADGSAPTAGDTEK